MERLSALDASFLAIEDGVDHMHIGSVGLFEGPPPTFDELHAFVGSKLPLVPRYRQKVLVAPFSVGRPVWVDDPSFRLDYHLRRVALPSPGGMRELRAVMGQVMSQQLDRHKPLWETWLIEGLRDDRWALLTKIHHCMVDGVAGTDLLAVVLDVDPAHALVEDPPVVDDWDPAPEPSAVELAMHSLGGLAASPVGLMRGLAGAARAPVSGALTGMRELGGLTSVVARLVRSAPSSSLTGPIGPHRCWVETRATLDDVKSVRVRFGGTVNDVVLAMVTSGIRALLISRGESVAGRTVRTLVPVSLRTADARGVFDNRVTALFADLPVGVADPVEALHEVCAQMRELKTSDEAVGAQALLGMTSFVPASAAALLARFVVHQQHTTETVATNVPGPQTPLYLLGRKMMEAYPYVPLAGKIRVGVAIWSYLGGLHFGVTGDEDSSSDVDVVARGIDEGLKALRHATAAA